MTKKPPLEWGETVWDDWPREKLLREVQRMYAAIISLQTVAKLTEYHDAANHDGKNSLFWTIGTGAKALDQARQILKPIARQYGEQEPMYRSFFRYAISLMFPNKEHFDDFRVWTICPKCGVMLGSNEKDVDENMVGKPCTWCDHKDGDEPGIVRKLRWSDLKRKAKTT